MSDDREIILLTAKDERTLACPLCSFTHDVPPIPVSDEIGNVFGLSGRTLAQMHGENLARCAAAEMRNHLAGHDVLDWLHRVVAS